MCGSPLTRRRGGIGGFLEDNYTAKEFFHGELTEDDVKIFKHTVGDNKGQQTWEALTILVALRLWAPRWKGRRVTLSVRSDSVSALTALLRFKNAGEGSSFIARELAIDIAESVYRPSIISHVPGVSNIIADELSRWYEPRRFPKLPLYLRGASLRMLPTRDASFYRTLLPP